MQLLKKTYHYRDNKATQITLVWTKIAKEYCIWIWNQQYQEVDQEIEGKMKWGRMEE
jgi:hypothetical protein